MNIPDEQPVWGSCQGAGDAHRKISENSGRWRGDSGCSAREQAAKKSILIGYDVMSGTFLDMLKAGIIDPAKVTKGALLNAASVAAMVLSTEAMITDLPEKEPPAGAGGPGGMGGMGGMDMY